MTAFTAASNGTKTQRKQLNIAIDGDLHHQLRVQSTIKKQSLREFSEQLIRSALAQELSDEGQDIAPGLSFPVNGKG